MNGNYCFARFRALDTQRPAQWLALSSCAESYLHAITGLFVLQVLCEPAKQASNCSTRSCFWQSHFCGSCKIVTRPITSSRKSVEIYWFGCKRRALKCASVCQLERRALSVLWRSSTRLELCKHRSQLDLATSSYVQIKRHKCATLVCRRMRCTQYYCIQEPHRQAFCTTSNWH